jgi:hypothetical protein
MWSARRKHWAAVRDHQAGGLALALSSRSHSSRFGLHVQRAGQVVEDQQLGLADEHARRCGALRLAAREACTPCAPIIVSEAKIQRS